MLSHFSESNGGGWEAANWAAFNTVAPSCPALSRWDMVYLSMAHGFGCKVHRPLTSSDSRELQNQTA